MFNEYEPRAGSTIADCAFEMISLANSTRGLILAKFNSVSLTVNPGDSTEAIVQFYHSQWESQEKAFSESSEGKAQATRAEVRRILASKAEAEGILPFSVVNQRRWEEMVDNNQDPYGSAIIRYASRWASMMEAKLAAGIPFQGIPEVTSFEADKEGVSGAMYEFAKYALGEIWIHGEQLRQWYSIT